MTCYTRNPMEGEAPAEPRRIAIRLHKSTLHAVARKRANQ